MTTAFSCAPSRTPTATAASISGSDSPEAGSANCSSTPRRSPAARTGGWCMPAMVRWNASMPTSLTSNMSRSAIRACWFFLLAAAIASLPSAAFAQVNAGRFVSGPLVWTPLFQLREAGIDSNVFNTPSNPKEDRTAAALAQIDSVLTLGIVRATTQGSVEYTYFDRYTEERAFNRRVNSRMDFPVSRLSPALTVSWDHVQERSNNEIDTRAPRRDFAYALGVQTKLTSRVAVTATGGKEKATYEPGFTFRDVEIAEQLNRETLQGSVTGRVALTPLTTLATSVSYGRDTFPFRVEAATDNVRADAGFEFAPDAIIRGRATIGYHSMQPRYTAASNAQAAEFTGITSAIDLGYNLLGMTRFTARFGHDSTYSASATQ